MEEAWKDMPGFEGLYKISDMGRVLSVRRNKILKPGPHGKADYLQVNLCNQGFRLHRNIHTLVLLAFCGPKPKGQITRHLDGNPRNNKLENLKYGTYKENERDKIAHGTYQYGDLNPNSHYQREKRAARKRQSHDG